jgi:general secretion pathway protein M
LKDRLNQLEERERQLLGVLVSVFVVFLALLLPIGITALVSSKRSGNEELREAMLAIERDQATVERMGLERQAVLERYSQPAPALAGFLADLAKQSGIDIPESQDLDPVPHGKRYQERSTRIVIRKTGMLALVRFMERIEQSPHPVRISRLNIRKRGTELDSFDVQMVVSAFDRKAQEQKQSEQSEEEEG